MRLICNNGEMWTRRSVFLSVGQQNLVTGRLSTMNEGGNFTWSYLAGSDLKSRVVYPNGVTVDYTYEPNRDLLTNIKRSWRAEKKIKDAVREFYL